MNRVVKGNAAYLVYGLVRSQRCCFDGFALSGNRSETKCITTGRVNLYMDTEMSPFRIE